ncbi:MAG: hypothetical protein AABY15_04010 [Nanoarchaeota archaeon]|mgnify:CR=1 FL=1
MDNSKTLSAEEKRKTKSSEVWIQFLEADGVMSKFNVLDEEGNIKYLGQIKDKEQSDIDNCTCPSFMYGMSYDKIESEYKGESNFVREHGYNFNCKHIIAARVKRIEVQHV